MALSDLYIAKEYRNLKCDVINDFYVPILSNAVMYKRAVGFFNSAALYEMAIGLRHLVEKQGKMELIVSPRLTEEDIQSIHLGYKTREEVIERALLRDFYEPKNKTEFRKLNLLANLIAEGVLDIKVAFKINANSAGIFHEKIGIVIDSEGNKVAFTGSMNETYSGLLQNYESIDVFCSWRDEDYDRVNIKENAFDNLWENLDTAMEVIPFPKVAIERLNSYKVEKTDIILDAASRDEVEDKVEFFHIPSSIHLHKYQDDAIETWLSKNGRGIFDMATGTGKTYTALGALSKLSAKLQNHLAVLIICPYQHLVEQWVDEIKVFGVKPLICYSRYNWKKQLKDTIEDYKMGIINNFCVITTNSTFVTPSMQNEIAKMDGDFCLVVDEAHNFGAKKQLACMSEKFNYRLALSATINRHHDEYGTQRLFDYFGDKCIEYTLKQAINENKLTPYYYYPVLVPFTEDELHEYCEITDKVANILKKVPHGDDLPQSAERLLIKRARIIAGAKEKVNALNEVIQKYKDKKHLLVYCGATKVESEYLSNDDIDSTEQRQIDEVTSLLGNTLHMKVTQFTSAEDSKRRELIKNEFSKGEIQALVAIKCLDEGMNIPGIETAFILASSTNPKEYIQRRGRVLRKAQGKTYATIYDFVTLPRPLDEYSYPSSVQAELSLVKREVERMRDFQELSENPSDVTEVIRLLTEKYNLYLIGDEYERVE